MDIYYSAGLNKRFLGFLQLYLNKNFRIIKIEHVYPVHIIKTCLTTNCTVHLEHQINEEALKLVITSDKALLAVHEPWVEDQDICTLLLNGRLAILPLCKIATIDELVWKLVHAIGHLYSLEHCNIKECAMSSLEPPLSTGTISTIPICLKHAAKLGVNL